MSPDSANLNPSFSKFLSVDSAPPTGGGSDGGSNANSGAPPYKKIRVYLDESGIHGANYYGFGSLWVTHERRGDFQALVDKHRGDHKSELKWSRVSRFNESFASGVIRDFFTKPWLMFHAIIIPRAYVDMSLHQNDRDLALRKHLAMFIKTKIQYFADGQPKQFHIITDPIPSRYAKADEAAHSIINRTLLRDCGPNVSVKSFTTRDSKYTAGIQVADLLLGATLAPWQGEVTAAAKTRISELVAWHLNWEDMHADTWKYESKFNVWHFFDPTAGLPRQARTRKVNLRFPVVPFRRRSR